MDLLDPRYAFVLKPIKDLVKNWEINIDAFLEDFMNEAVTSGANQLDFAKASVVLQGSVSVWAKKVDFVSKLCEEVMGLVAFEEEQEDGDVGGRRSYKPRTKRESNIMVLNGLKMILRKMEEDCSSEGNKWKRCYHLNLATENSSVRGSKLTSATGYYDSVVNFYDQLSNHLAIAADSNFCLVWTPDQPLEGAAEDNGQQEMDFMSVPIADDDDANDVTMVDGAGCYDDDVMNEDSPSLVENSQQHPGSMKTPSMKDVTTLVHANHDVTRRNRHQQTLLPSPQIEDEVEEARFEYLNFDDVCSDVWKDRVIRVKKSSFVNFNKRKSSSATPVASDGAANGEHVENSNLPTLLHALRELTGKVTSKTKLSKCSAEQNKKFDELKKSRIREIKSRHRKPRVKRKAKKRKANARKGDGEADDMQQQQDEDVDMDVEDIIAECIDEVDIESRDQDGVLFDDNPDDDEVHGFTPDNTNSLIGDFADQSMQADAYRKLQEYVDKCFQDANNKVKKSDIERRVQEWENRILPYLQSCSKMPSFDIGATSRIVLGNLESFVTSQESTTPPDDDDNFLKMMELTQGNERWDLARKFASILQLANDGNVELRTENSSVGSINTLAIKLLDSQHKDKLSHL